MPTSIRCGWIRCTGIPLEHAEPLARFRRQIARGLKNHLQQRSNRRALRNVRKHENGRRRSGLDRRRPRTCYFTLAENRFTYGCPTSCRTVFPKCGAWHFPMPCPRSSYSVRRSTSRRSRRYMRCTVRSNPWRIPPPYKRGIRPGRRPCTGPGCRSSIPAYSMTQRPRMRRRRPRRMRRPPWCRDLLPMPRRRVAGTQQPEQIHNSSWFFSMFEFRLIRRGAHHNACAYVRRFRADDPRELRNIRIDK